MRTFIHKATIKIYRIRAVKLKEMLVIKFLWVRIWVIINSSRNYWIIMTMILKISKILIKKNINYKVVNILIMLITILIIKGEKWMDNINKVNFLKIQVILKIIKFLTKSLKNVFLLLNKMDYNTNNLKIIIITKKKDSINLRFSQFLDKNMKKKFPRV